ncbi:hypothetical protein [Amycolatopsis sp. CM201R]|uniref:hypothetical protein n=1 Tax=Amycolatopsis sp. CM201R TaxID=2761537 RepID=UPI0028753DD0|nr:hypothetical protein [Amycolatopsis sp. CM201R]MDS0149032.1 hypothetical protein [Amycolatopsis sp. CM201R]
MPDRSINDQEDENTGDLVAGLTAAGRADPTDAQWAMLLAALHTRADAAGLPAPTVPGRRNRPVVSGSPSQPITRWG